MRKILLELAEDTTETECGGCPMFRSFDYEDGRDRDVCLVFPGVIRDGWEKGAGETIRRLPACIAAEKRAEWMVEIDPEIAARRHYDSRARWEINVAMQEHARKAVQRG